MPYECRLSCFIKGLCVDSLAMAVSTVKILALRMRNLCLDTLIELLKCFPSLEKLYIKVMILHHKFNYSFGQLMFSSELFNG
jgi:hypothetical protein